MLSFSPELATKLNKFGVIPILADILSDAQKEKVRRLSLMKLFTEIRVVVQDLHSFSLLNTDPDPGGKFLSWVGSGSALGKQLDPDPHWKNSLIRGR